MTLQREIMGRPLPYNRIAIIAFAFLVLGGVALLIAKTMKRTAAQLAGPKLKA